MKETKCTYAYKQMISQKVEEHISDIQTRVSRMQTKIVVWRFDHHMNK